MKKKVIIFSRFFKYIFLKMFIVKNMEIQIEREILKQMIRKRILHNQINTLLD